MRGKFSIDLFVGIAHNHISDIYILSVKSVGNSFFFSGIYYFSFPFLLFNISELRIFIFSFILFNVNI